MGKLQELERTLEELRKVCQFLRDRADTCLHCPASEKVRVYDSVMPLIKSAVEKSINGDRDWKENLRELQINVTDKLLKAFGGEDVLSKLDKL